ncbi:MAG TPA: substrate-binding domain-containing protein [Terriglobia bacterium]|jgi:molybdate/tungstate transport system substrate-binding protein
MWNKAILLILCVGLASVAEAQTPNCVPLSNQQMIIYRAGSLTRAFQELEKVFTCRTGVQVEDFPMGSVDAGRQITAGGHAADLYAPADYLDIDLFMKPAGYSDFNIVFAQGRMVLAYSASGLSGKKLPPITAPGSAPFHSPASIPKAAPNWYEILTTPGVAIGGGNWFLDPGAYRAPMMFQLAAEYYKVPNLYNNLLEHLVIMGQDSGAVLGKQFDFQFTYEHNARFTAAGNPDYRYVDLPDEINLSDPAKDAYYRQHAIVVLPGLGTSRSAHTIPVPGAHVAWGITLLKDALNRQNAIKFLELLLSPEGTSALKKNGPDPLSAAIVSAEDFRNLPEPLRPLVRQVRR